MLPHERGSSFKRTCEMPDSGHLLPLALLHLRRRQAAHPVRGHRDPRCSTFVRPLDAPFEMPSSFRHSAAPSDSTFLQDPSANHHTSLEGSIMMIAGASLLKARAPDVSCAQLGSATPRARHCSPGRCSLNDMGLFFTPLYMTRQAPPCVLRIIIFCHQGAWPDSLLNYHLLSPIARASLNRAARPGFSWPAQAPLFGVANPVEICGVEEWSVAEGRSGAPRLSTAYNSPPGPAA